MSAFISAMDATGDAQKKVRGENGAPEWSVDGVGDARVALFFKLVRNLSQKELEDLMGKIWSSYAQNNDVQQLIDLFVMAFQTRACRGSGKGEKDLFYMMLLALYLKFPTTAIRLLELVPHYGYYKDYFLILEKVAARPDAAEYTALVDAIVARVVEQLQKDWEALKEAEAAGKTPSLSLLGKYAPREGKHTDKKLQLVKRLSAALFPKLAGDSMAARRQYRKMVSGLNAALGTVECYMAAQRYEEIEFAKVPSLCLMRQRKAFLNEKVKGKLDAGEEETGNRHPGDEGRVAARQHLREALLAKKGVKGKQLQPHEVVEKLHGGGYGRRAATPSTMEKDLLQAQWEQIRAGVLENLQAAAAERAAEMAEGGQQALSNLSDLKAALPRKVDLGRLVPLVDVSGSMQGTPMMVAIALGILVSELAQPAFRDRFLTFETAPKWVSLEGCSSIAEKVARTAEAPWGGSTNFEAALRCILETAVRAKLTPDQIPDLIVFSDMQFDQARGGYGYGNYGHQPQSWETHHEKLMREFAAAGRRVCGQPYAPTRIIFWNLRSNTVGFPVQADAPNTQMISGFSPSLLKLVLAGEDLVGDEVEVEEIQADGTVVKRLVKEGPTPYQTLRKALDDEHYDPVRLAVQEVGEGVLAEYQFEKDDFEVV